MQILDFTHQGRRPSVRQIIATWRRVGRPIYFQAEYGETYAEFTRSDSGRWFTQGNGARGIDRDGVLKALAQEPI